ncbi:MAG TPA: hypothetical protein VH306_00115 [Gaiellaceae bacterium]
MGGLAASLVLVVSSAIAGTGIGGVFNLGRINPVNAPSTLSGATSGETLTLVNSGRGATLRLRPAAGRAPIVVGASAGKAKNLNADKLDGLDSESLKTRGKGDGASFVNINGCGSGPLVEYAVTLTRRGKIFAAATSVYGRSNPGPERPTIEVRLLNGSRAVVARSGRVTVDATSGNPSLSVAGLLFADDGTVYTARAGTYTLQLAADNFGACTGFGQYQSPRLSHIVVN